MSRPRNRLLSTASPKVLTLAVLATLLLFLAGLFLSAAAVASTLDEAADLARNEEQTAYHFAEISRGMSRLRANVVEAVTDPLKPASVRLTHARNIEARMLEAMDDLPPFLGPDELAQWNLVRPNLGRLLEEMHEVMALIEAGDDAAAEARLDELAPQFDAVNEDLHAWESVSIDDTRNAIGAIESRGTRIRKIICENREAGSSQGLRVGESRDAPAGGCGVRRGHG